MIDWLLAPWQFQFMREAFYLSILIAIPTALLSCFLVLRGWSLMGDAIAHAVLPGIVLAYIFAIPLAAGAFAAGMICSLSIGYLQENSRVKEDTIMGVVFSGMFALGLLLYTSIESDIHLDHVLFGNMLGIEDHDFRDSLWISVVITLLILAKWRDYLSSAFDSVHARAIGLPATLLHYSLLVMISLCVVGALKSVGLILSIGLLIAPGAIAYLLCRNFVGMMIVSTSTSISAALIGIYISFAIDSAPAPTIILVLFFQFCLCFAWQSFWTRKAAVKSPQ